LKAPLTLLALAAATLALGASPAQATIECRGLTICVPVTGPWVVLPAGPGTIRPRVEFQLPCPRRFVVGGLDAELSDRAIDVGFLGLTGSPVNPGITTTRAALFLGIYAGRSAGTPSFRPHIGCIPSGGAGTRVPTAVAVFAPGVATARHVRTVRLTPGRRRVVVGCSAGERLIGASHAIGFYAAAPPAETLAAAVSATQAIRAGRAVVSVRSGAAVAEARAVVQVSALCGGGR
jgi:hypothetical protein